MMLLEIMSICTTYFFFVPFFFSLEKPTVTGLASLEGKTVTDLFPDFRPGKVLRFSRLFGPKKYISAQWKGLKKKKRKRKLVSVDNNTPRPTGFELRYGPPPKPEEMQPDEKVSILSIYSNQDSLFKKFFKFHYPE